jgi:hypothetical protein
MSCVVRNETQIGDLKVRKEEREYRKEKESKKREIEYLPVGLLTHHTASV